MLLRAISTFFNCFVEVIIVCFLAFISRPGRGRVAFLVICARRLPRLLERIGGAFPKVGQVLSTRSDLLPELVCQGLARLQDDTRPLCDKQVALLLQRSGLGEQVCQLALQPTASATIAQVHRAMRKDDGRVVALKILRPGTRRMLEADCKIAALAGVLLSMLPQARGVPVREAIAEASRVLLGQTDFCREAGNLERLARMFSGIPEVQVPALHRDLSGPDILVMDFIDGMRKIDDPLIPQHVAHAALTAGVCALFRMIFLEGFLHCDLHPGNMLVGPDGQLVILDAGFVAEFDGVSRRSFAEFFLSIAVRDGYAAAKIIRETARRLPENLDIEAFDNEISVLVNRFGGKKAREFQVAGFVIELFSIQRRHGIHGTSKFTLPILSLLVFEGVAKQRHPDLDFQAQSVPYVVAAMARPAGNT
jgi:ubiquinone biosynthesis protein